MKKLAIFGLMIFMLAGFASASLICESYDDFSSGKLDNEKWTESLFNAPVFADEHYVNSKEGKYHVAQYNPGDTGTVLTPTHQFVSGEVLKYNIIYNSGEGNHAYQPLIDGNYPPALNESCNSACGPIGYWNGVPDVGNQIGTYLVSMSFYENAVGMITIRPDSTFISHTFLSVTSPYLIGMNIHTGHNGLMHFDVDNVQICNPGPYCLADVNADNLVDGADIGTLLGNWGSNVESDLNGDEVVDGADIGILLGSWGSCS